MPDLHLMRLVDRTAVHKLEDMFCPISKREICFRYQLQRVQVHVIRSCPFHVYGNPIKRILNCDAAIYGSNDYSSLELISSWAIYTEAQAWSWTTHYHELDKSD